MTNILFLQHAGGRAIPTNGLSGGGIGAGGIVVLVLMLVGLVGLWYLFTKKKKRY